MMNVLELTAHIPGAVLKGDGSVLPTSVTTDSRSCCRGALFFALRGERYDGHDFAPSE